MGKTGDPAYLNLIEQVNAPTADLHFYARAMPKHVRHMTSLQPISAL